MNSKDIQKAIDVLNWVIRLLEKGSRDGWGYDKYSLAVTMSTLYNELLIAEEMECKNQKSTNSQEEKAKDRSNTSSN